MRTYPLAFALIFSALCAQCPADIITLQSGEKIQGKILSETTAEITVNVKVSDTISDERSIPRSEIKNVEKTGQDELDYLEIKDMKPDPLAAQPAMIDRSIAVLNTFLQKYPLSQYAAGARVSLELFQKEKEHLSAGEIKYYGTWISKGEAAKRKVQIDGAALFSTMKQQAAAGDYVGALNSFDQLEKNASGSQAYPMAAEFAKQVLSVLSQQVTRTMAKLAHDMGEWNRGVVITAEPQKSQIIAAQKAEQEKYDALIDAAQKNGVKWTPFLPRSDKSLQILAAAINAENQRLTVLPIDKMTASLQRMEQAREPLARKNVPAAESILKEAVLLWPQNDEAVYMLQIVGDEKAAAAKTAEEAARATPTPKPKPTAVPATAVVTGQETPKPAATPLPAVPEEKQTWLEFFMTIQGAMTIVGGAIVLLVVVTLAQKLKKPKAEPIQ